MFHVQELETLKRQGFRILICAMNDGGYGAEFHKLCADGLDDILAVLRSKTSHAASACAATSYAMFSLIPQLFAHFSGQGEREMWNIQMSDKVMAPAIRQTIKRGHGNI